MEHKLNREGEEKSDALTFMNKILLFARLFMFNHANIYAFYLTPSLQYNLLYQQWDS